MRFSCQKDVFSEIV